MYNSIRPYNDSEVQPVLQRLVCDRSVLNLLARYRLSRLHRVLPGVSRIAMHLFLRWKTRRITTINGFQRAVTERYLTFLLDKTTTALHPIAIDRIIPEKAKLFISNHRDIVLDSALTNYCLHQQGLKSFRSATGDNLATIPFVQDMLRLNKSFLVNRSETSPRKKLMALKELSCYIRDSITQDNESVWIAQREGRAKDSFDTSDLGVIKMLYLCARDRPIHDYFRQLHTHSISVSYEYDPCDLLKAQERYAIDTTGSYEKKEGEDMHSTITGLTGFKGRVSVHFGEAIAHHQFDNEQELAAIIDRSIVTNYQLYPSNYTALRLLSEQAQNASNEYQQAYHWFLQSQSSSTFRDSYIEEKYQQTAAHLQTYLMENYANPCVAYWRLHHSNDD